MTTFVGGGTAMKKYMLVYEGPGGCTSGAMFSSTYEYAERLEDNLIEAGFYCELYERVENESGIGLEYRCMYK